jgi:hypothetical protein
MHSINALRRPRNPHSDRHAAGRNGNWDASRGTSRPRREGRTRQGVGNACPSGGQLDTSEAILDFELKRCKRTLRILLRTAYTDERLTVLLDHSRNGEVDFRLSCLLGSIALHQASLGKSTGRPLPTLHRYQRAVMLLTAYEGEWALYRLGFIRRTSLSTSDELRGRRLAPMVRAEIRRRSRPQRQPRLVWSD